MSAFLFVLVKLNLAMGMAIIVVALLRRPLRRAFGARIAYAVWFLVPVAGVASLFPPRVAAPAIAPIAPAHVSAGPVSVMGRIAYSAWHVKEQLTEHSALAAIAGPQLASAHAMPGTALTLFAVWALGAVLMASYLTRLQLRFSSAVRRGEAGPAVLGFLRPRIVTPAGFQDYFSQREQAAILAHERIHLARQDARINALTALLRCFCWFNPLIHLGVRWLRIDQELACDATAVTGAVSRRDYAKALLKSQMMITALPLGCNWPGPQHPLIERIALLQRKPPGAARRIAGLSLVMLAAAFAGLGAWAVQPPVVYVKERVQAALSASQIDDRHQPQPLPAGEPAAEPSRSKGAGHTGLPQGAAPDRAETAKGAGAEGLSPPFADLSGLPPISPTATPAVLASTSPPAMTQNDQPAAVVPPAAQTPRNRTEMALSCWLGILGRQGCWEGDGCNGGDGPVERVEYLGSNAAGADIYEVRYMHRFTAYVVAPDPNGKTGDFLVKAADRYLVKKDISSRAAPVLIYTRPEDAPAAGCNYRLPAETVDPPNLFQPTMRP